LLYGSVPASDTRASLHDYGAVFSPDFAPGTPVHPAGKDQTHLIPAMLRKLSCHVLVTHLVEMLPARHIALKNLL
jgi:hypothetical protein